ncbi:MAG: tetratricopeptide repeat protein [Promethearchaeia archaeon]
MSSSEKFQKSSRLFTEGKYNDAISLLKEVLEEEPDNIIFWNYLGKIYVKTERFDDAIEAYRTALEINPKSYSSWQNLGSAFYEKGDLKHAVVALKKSFSLDKNNILTLNKLAKIHKELGNLKRAKHIYIRILKSWPKNALAWSNLGVIYFHENKYNKVISAFKKAVKIVPNNVFYWNNLGLAYLKRGILDKAIYACKCALDLDLTYQAAWHNLCKGYNTRGLDFKYKEKDPNKGESWYSLANTLYKANYYQDALDSIERAIKIEGQNERFFKLRKKIKKVLKEKKGEQKSKKIPNKIKHSFRFFKKPENKKTVAELEKSTNIKDIKQTPTEKQQANQETKGKYKISTLISSLSEGEEQKEDTVFISEKQYNLVDTLFVVDGANIAYGDTRGGNKAKFSNIEKLVKRLDEMGVNYKIFTDRSLYYKIDDRSKYDQYVEAGKILEMPGGTEADYFILQYAQENNAFIISNDMFKEFYQIFGREWILDHRVSFKIIEDQVFFDKLLKR